MKRCVMNLCVALLVGSFVLGAYAEKADKKAKAKPARVYAPYHKLKLTDDQRVKIVAIQAEIRAEIAKLRQQEAERVEAVLTDEQKTEVAKQKQEDAKRRAEYAKAYRERQKSKAKNKDEKKMDP